MAKLTRAEKIAILGDLSEELLNEQRTANEFHVDSAKRVGVYLESQRRGDMWDSLRIGGNLSRVSYTFGAGKWYTFQTDANGEIRVLDSRNRIRPQIKADANPGLYMPADNYGRGRHLVLRVEED